MGQPRKRSQPVDDQYLSVTQAATYLGLCQKTVQNMLLDGRLKAFTLGPRVVRIRKSDIDSAFVQYGSANA
jgi:excisionase family DNA binding protein